MRPVCPQKQTSLGSVGASMSDLNKAVQGRTIEPAAAPG